MATRTICFPISGYPYCKEQPVTFTWIKGSKRQNIRAVHDAVHTTDPDVSILEVSSASVQPEGEGVSSLRLLLHLDSVAQDVPISTVFEATKVFEHGGPFADLLTCEPPKVHKDTRLRTNGKLLRYSLEGSEYPIEPHPDSFFEWLYCRALKQLPEKAYFEADGWSYGIAHQYDNGYGTVESRYAFDQYWNASYGAECDGKRRLIFGHTHRQCIHTLGEGMEWINPGSISYRRPDDPDKTAHYAVILDGKIQLKSIAYDRTLQLAEAKRFLKNDRMMRTELQDFMFFFGDAKTSRDPL